MGELRWILLLLGLAALAAVYLYSRYKPQDFGRASRRGDRREPVIDQHAIAQTLPDEEPAGDAAPEPPPAIPEKVITIRLMARGKPGFAAERLVLALREAGFRHGRFGIFHRHAEAEGEAALFSVASLVEPGSFDLSQLKTAHYPGVSIFMALPGPDDDLKAFDMMLETARALAGTLEGDLCDERGNSLSIQRQRFLREEVIQFQHRQGLY